MLNNNTHSKFLNKLQICVDFEAIVAWTTRNNMFSETKEIMMAIQDQVIKAKNNQKYTSNDGTLNVAIPINYIPYNTQVSKNNANKLQKDKVMKILYCIKVLCRNLLVKIISSHITNFILNHDRRQILKSLLESHSVNQ